MYIPLVHINLGVSYKAYFWHHTSQPDKSNFVLSELCYLEKCSMRNQDSLTVAKYVPAAIIINAKMKIAEGISRKIIRDSPAPIKGETA